MSFAWLSYRGASHGRRAPLSSRARLILGAAFLVGPLLLGALGGCGDVGSTGDAPNPHENGPDLEFVDQGTLELRPHEVVDIAIKTDARAHVTLLLLGDALDASLATATIRADASGDAKIRLTAPSKPTTFVLRAQNAAGAKAELHVAVSEQGFTTLRIVPVYDGERALDAWSADVLVGGNCESILANYPIDPVGALHVAANSRKGLEIGSVPVGPVLAVAVRSESLAAGCVSFTASKPDGTEEVTITVLDKPMLLGQADLEIELEYAPDPTSYATLVGEAASVVANTAFPLDVPLAPLLLDTMGLTMTDDASYSLSLLREQSDLDLELDLLLGVVDPNGLCASLAEPAGFAAATDVTAGAPPIEGVIRGKPSAPLAPSFELVSFAGLDAAALGAPAAVPFSWSATADDVLVMSGLLPLSPTRLAGAYMNRALTAQLGEPTTVPLTIAASIDCAAVASQIVALGEVAACNAACLAASCEAAVDLRWQLGIAAGDSVDGSTGSLQIGVSGEATVSEDLLPVALLGSWLGTLKGFQKQSTIMGSASGHAPPAQ